MTLEEAARALDMSPATVWRRYKAGELTPVTPINPALRRQAPLRFYVADVERLRTTPAQRKPRPRKPPA